MKDIDGLMADEDIHRLCDLGIAHEDTQLGP